MDFLFICLGISSLVIGIGILIALVNVSLAYKRKHEPRERADERELPTPARNDLEKRLEDLKTQRFGPSMLDRDGTVMGGNPNASRMVLLKEKKNGTGKGNKC